MESPRTRGALPNLFKQSASESSSEDILKSCLVLLPDHESLNIREISMLKSGVSQVFLQSSTATFIEAFFGMASADCCAADNSLKRFHLETANFSIISAGIKGGSGLVNVPIPTGCSKAVGCKKAVTDLPIELNFQFWREAKEGTYRSESRGRFSGGLLRSS